MPLTPFQAEIAKLISTHRTEDSHLAGGAALHSQKDSIRYSEDLDYFHDSEVRVNTAFEKDHKLLSEQGYSCSVEMNRPGYIRCLVQKKNMSTKLEWAHDSAWRFMPVQKHPDIGYVLHPIDLATNKVLALVGRDEARDFLDVVHVQDNILPLGALTWAACGKDPGFSPNAILELLKRRGKYRPEDFTRLHLNEKIDIQALKQKWLKALSEAEIFVNRAPAEQLGCLYYSKSRDQFIQPEFPLDKKDIVSHYGRLGGVLPIFKD